jgi:hypothetical protein
MGGGVCNICSRCDEHEKENEMKLLHEKPLMLAKPVEQQNNKYDSI